VLAITISLLVFLAWYIRRKYFRAGRRVFELEDGERRLRMKLRRSPRKGRGWVAMWEKECERERWRDGGGG
jgi:hypothetical protein